MSPRDDSDDRAGRPWLTRNVKVLSAVSLAQDTASEMMYPLMPVLLTGVLGAPAVVVGLVEGVAEGVAALLKYVSGRWSDRVGRKPLVTAGYGLAAVGKVIIAAALVWPAVLLGRVVDRIGKGVRGAPRDALLAEGAVPEVAGRIFGFHRAADTLGAVLGPLLGLIVLQITGDLGTALWVAVVPAAISVALVGLTRESPVPPAHRRVDSAGPLPRPTRRVAVVLSVIAVVNFPDALVLLHITQIGFTTSELVACYALFNLANAAIAYPAGALSDRWPRSRVYALGLICFAVGYIGLALVSGGWQVVALLVVYGGFAGITDGVGKAWISTVTPAALHGRAQGLFQGLTGVGVLIAGLWAGLAWQSGSGSGTVPLLVSGSVAVVAAAGLWSLGHRLT